MSKIDSYMGQHKETAAKTANYKINKTVMKKIKNSAEVTKK
jgi:hypothetical protein